MYLNLNFILLLLISALSTAFSPNSGNHEQLVAQGRIQYEVLRLDSRMPRYGTCWTEALSDLEQDCKHLDDEVQSRLSLTFANCFLEKAGLRTYPCARTEQISDCLRNVDNNAFTTYSNFFTHTQNMCYFLQSQVWQEETENTVQRLASSSDKVSRSMEESFKIQGVILEGQQQTLEYHRQLLENGSHLSRAIEASKDNVRDMLLEFKTSTDEQKNLIFEVFDRVARLQNLVVSEVNWLYTVVFYGACLLVTYLVTATRRTADARLHLFVILSLNLLLERTVCHYSLPSDHSKVVNELSETVYERIWLVRQCSIGVCMFVLLVFVYRFKDYNVINNSLLQEIKKQNQELKRSMEMYQVGNRVGYQMSHDVYDGAGFHFSPSLSALLAEDTGFQGDEEEDEFSDDDSDSFNSTRTDATFDPSRSGDWSDEFNTAENSREHSGNVTPTNQEIDDALEDLSGRLVSSVDHYPSILDCSVQSVKPVAPSSAVSPPAGRRGRTQGARVSTPTPDRDRYNLRSRTPVAGNRRTEDKRTVDMKAEDRGETPEEFAKMVKAQLGRTKRNYSKWQLAVKKQNQGDFSSDEGN